MMVVVLISYAGRSDIELTERRFAEQASIGNSGKGSTLINSTLEFTSWLSGSKGRVTC